ELTPPLIAFRGFANATGKLDGMAIDELWEIGDDYVCRDSLRLPAKLVSGKRGYQLTINPNGENKASMMFSGTRTGKEKQELTFHAANAAKDEFTCSGYGADLRLKKITADEGAKIRQQIEKEQSLDHILGFMKTQEHFPTIWEIGKDHITIGTVKFPATSAYTTRTAYINLWARTNGAIIDGKTKYDAQVQINGETQIWQFVVEGDKVYRLNEDNRGQITLSKITAEEAKTLREQHEKRLAKQAEEARILREQQEKKIAEKKALLEKVKGHWLAYPAKPEACGDFLKKERAYPLIIANDYMIDDNTKGAIRTEVLDGEAVFRYDPGKHQDRSREMYVVKSLSEDGATMRILYINGRNKREIEYHRMQDSEEAAIRAPELKQFFGKWVLEASSCETFKTLDISVSSISFDGEKHPVKSFSRNGCGFECNPLFKKSPMLNYVMLRCLPSGKIAVGYVVACEDNYDYTERNVGYYRKVNDEEYRAMLAKVPPSPLSGMAGYWKSAETKIGDHKWLVYGKLGYTASTDPDNGTPNVSLNLVVCRSEYGEKPYEIVDWSNTANQRLYACLVGGDTAAKVYYLDDHYFMNHEHLFNYNLQIIDANSLKLLSRSWNLNNIVLKRADKQDMEPYFKKFPE
ncbi:MAG: hypothetical protein J6333_12775, partial [Planctomycetes bacterium]|nr:hypothetical protein [Planctomycetota bacterium]